MSKRHKGNFRAKHSPDVTIAAALEETVSNSMPHGKITCKKAFTIAIDLATDPAMVGTAIDLQEGHITACQLGLFGHGGLQSPIPDGSQPAEGLKDAIHASLINGRLPCKQAWRIAKQHDMEKLEVGRACESSGIRISQCQLGAF